MSRVPVPFEGRPVRFEKVLGRRFKEGSRASERRALLEILDDPDYRQLERTLQELRANVDSNGRAKRGRPAKWGIRQLLAPVTAALVFNDTLEAAYSRVFEDAALRTHLG